ncbi:MAG: DUF1501 domain-containing protein [Phycisphaera sp.]|nr:DUF1501 domain-containing protein [Phycisphaera sp.]
MSVAETPDALPGRRHRSLSPPCAIAQGYSQLLRDLKSRGLLDQTLVVLTTEFGRSPAYKGDGRNHYPAAFSVALAGAGVKGGYVHGATDEAGGHVTDKPVTVGELHASVGWAMGIRPEDTIMSPSGRPFKIGNSSQPVMNVFA